MVEVLLHSFSPSIGHLLKMKKILYEVKFSFCVMLPLNRWKSLNCLWSKPNILEAFIILNFVVWYFTLRKAYSSITVLCFKKTNNENFIHHKILPCKLDKKFSFLCWTGGRKCCQNFFLFPPVTVAISSVANLYINTT